MEYWGLPANTPFTVTAVGEVQIAVAKSPSDKAFKPAIVNPEDVVIKNLGKPGWEREAHFILDERVEANRNFANKVWNASRFIMMNMDEELPAFLADSSISGNLPLSVALLAAWVEEAPSSVVRTVSTR